MCTWAYAWYCSKEGLHIPFLFLCAFAADAAIVTSAFNAWPK